MAKHCFHKTTTVTFVKCGCSNIFFLNSANLVCGGTDISKYLIESLGIRNNESRLYIRSAYCLASVTEVTMIISANQLDEAMQQNSKMQSIIRVWVA